MKAAIVSPSAPSTHSEERNKQFQTGLAVLNDLGIEYIIMPHAQDSLGYVASSTTDRLSDLHAAYKDKSVDIIIAANGGWNCSHLLSKLDYGLIKNNPKPLAGASDITALLNAIYAKTGAVQLYGPMITWGLHNNNAKTNQSFAALVKDHRQEFALSDFGKWLKSGQFNGAVVGGNLVSMASLLGTPYEPDWQDKIFVWEDTEESVYRLDRALTHFKNAGAWGEIKGMVIGHLDQVDEDFAGKKFDAMQMICDLFADYDFPILKTDLFGHNIPTQITLPMGGKLTADDQKVTMSWQS